MEQNTRALDALLDRMLARRRELAENVPGVTDFAEVSADPYFPELRELRRACRQGLTDEGKTGRAPDQADPAATA